VKKVREQFRHLKSDTKKKAAEVLRGRNRTGGGEWEEADMDEIQQNLADFLEWEKKILKVVGVCGIFGIAGGLDTSLEVSCTATDMVQNSLYKVYLYVTNTSCMAI
jgi:hypothetical protein